MWPGELDSPAICLPKSILTGRAFRFPKLGGLFPLSLSSFSGESLPGIISAVSLPNLRLSMTPAPPGPVRPYKTPPGFSKPDGSDCPKTPGESERAAALSKIHRTRRRGRRVREDDSGGDPIFQRKILSLPFSRPEIGSIQRKPEGVIVAGGA